MRNSSESQNTPGYSFQVDLLNLNLHLTETERAPETQTRAHEAALEQMRTLVSRA